MAGYPERRMAPAVVRYSCMIFGMVNIVGCVVQYGAHPRDTFPLAGLVVGGAWFAFGKYGGLPLFDTVDDWHPPRAADVVERMHREGLRVMRRRRRTMWAASLLVLPVMALFMGLVMRDPARLAPLLLMSVAVPTVFLSGRYYLSRCPRCGLGFFTTSSSRAAFIHRIDMCGHCYLPLDAYKRGVH